MRHLNIDIETYSSVDLKTGGLYKYAQAPDFNILLFGYSIDGAEPVVLEINRARPLPENIIALLMDTTVIKHAYNAIFEWYCIAKYLRLSDEGAIKWLPDWRDTMLHAMYCGYPAALAASGAALGLPQDKRKLNTGKALIRTFCVPRKPTESDPRTRIYPKDEPEKWELFKEYNAQDVVSEQEIERRLSSWPVPDKIQRQWELDAQTNLRGVAVDLELVAGALMCSADVTRELTDEAVEISVLKNPNSVSQLSSWLVEEIDEEVPDLRKDTVSQLLQRGVPSEAAQRMLEIRQELGKTSNKKYAAMANAACSDNRLRGALMFYGAARTGRWAGRMVQPQNLPRTHLLGIDAAREMVKREQLDNIRMCYGSVPNTLSQLIRTALVPASGCAFVDADFSAIEARVIAWLAGERWVLDVFRTHGRIYEATASQMFGVPIDFIVKGRPEYELRQKGKVATLALGYQGSSGALIKMGALDMGLTEDELPEIVQRWRDANRRIVAFWYALESAALETIFSARPHSVGLVTFSMSCDTEHAFLQVRLPGGRDLFYAQPFITKNNWGKNSIGYYGQNGGKWQALETYGGKLAENITQAVARDCLAEALTALDAAGHRVVFHVHDEVIIEAPQAAAEATLRDVCDIMGRPVEWAPGLPLKADGWIGEYYTKD